MDIMAILCKQSGIAERVSKKNVSRKTSHLFPGASRAYI